MLVKLQTAEVNQNTKSNYDVKKTKNKQFYDWQLSRKNISRQSLADKFLNRNIPVWKKKKRSCQIRNQDLCHPRRIQNLQTKKPEKQQKSNSLKTEP